ncbi:MAG: ATP-grasp domain-containing protein [Pseudomonadota bacterium]
MSVLVVAALSARLLAEAAALDGHRVVALDLFGDADTRRAAQRWVPIGAPGSLHIEADRVLAALDDAVRADGAEAIGWIPGSGFEGRLDLLAAGAQRLRLIGTPADAVRRVRDPRAFFSMLDAHGIGHPEVRFTPPTEPAGWLLKDARGSGGWHIRAARADDASPADGALYFQRAMAGVPMSATFIADGARAELLGINELIVRPIGARPHVYAGCIGPVPVPDALTHELARALQALVEAFGLRGWCSLDFIRGGSGGGDDDGDAVGVLEVNPRPPASLALYARRGLIDAQVRACLHGELPRLPSPGASAPRSMAGHEIVYANRPLTLSERGAQHLAERADVHDRPSAGARFAAGDPVCTLSATGDDAATLRPHLAAACDDLITTLETLR